MLLLISCLGLTYLSLVAQVMGQGTWGGSLSAVVLVLVMHRFSPPIPGIWALCLGLMSDGLGRGPLGLHAVVLLVLCAVLPRIGFDGAPCSVWRWGWATFLVAWWDGAASAVMDDLPRRQWERLEDELLRIAAQAAITGCCMAACVALGRRVRQRPSWNMT
ncbi:MAG: hypothetical protein U0872_00225 [Planctomycetaceae bacterium]